jgi:hypothetical protein
MGVPVGSPDPSPDGSGVTLTCRGFAPSEPVDVRFGAVVVATTKATTGGEAAASFPVPSGFAGSHYPGDRRWRQVLGVHDELTGRVVEEFQGQLVKTTGDGILATFDGPGRAIRCAAALRDELRGIGLQLRAGLHTGEVELRDGDVGRRAHRRPDRRSRRTR